MEDDHQEWASEFAVGVLVCVVWPCSVGCKDGVYVR